MNMLHIIPDSSVVNPNNGLDGVKGEWCVAGCDEWRAIVWYHTGTKWEFERAIDDRENLL